MNLDKHKGKKTKKHSKTVVIRLNQEAYEKVKTIAVKCECTMSDAVIKHLHLTK